MTPIVFVHGFLGGSRQWDGQVDALDAGPVVALDLPGFGQRAAVKALNSIGAYADWVLETLASQGIERFNLLGHSMGGMVVQDMASRAPDRIERLVLYGTGATGVLPGRFETICTSKERARAEGARATARRIAATWFSNEANAESYEACAAIAEECNLDTLLSGLDAMANWDGADRLAEIRAKTLVLWGDMDRTYPWHQTEYLWRTIPDASLYVIPDAAHAAHLEKPSQFNSAVREFLLQ